MRRLLVIAAILVTGVLPLGARAVPSCYPVSNALCPPGTIQATWPNRPFFWPSQAPYPGPSGPIIPGGGITNPLYMFWPAQPIVLAGAPGSGSGTVLPPDVTVPWGARVPIENLTGASLSIIDADCADENGSIIGTCRFAIGVPATSIGPIAQGMTRASIAGGATPNTPIPFVVWKHPEMRGTITFHCDDPSPVGPCPPQG